VGHRKQKTPTELVKILRSLLLQYQQMHFQDLTSATNESLRVIVNVDVENENPEELMLVISTASIHICLVYEYMDIPTTEPSLTDVLGPFFPP
jgi:hypothetical protein